MKSGYKTTEFWAFLAGLGTVAMGFLQTKCQFSTVDIVAITSLVGAYIVSRSWVKTKR